MKRTMQWLGAFAALAILATGCSKDETTGGQNLAEGEKGFVQLTLSTEALASRAATAGAATATPDELAVVATDGLTVAVFNEDGSFNYGAQALTLAQGDPGEYVSAPIAVEAGNLFFFVFANNGTGGKITAPTGGDINAFMASVAPVVYTANVPDIATPGEFLLGSLWRQYTLTPAGGTDAEPVQVEIPAIGRLSSKVVMNEVNLAFTGTSGLLGAFTDAKYRPGSVATAINYVGVHKPAAPLWKGTDLPYVAATLVESAKHMASHVTPNSDFLANTSFTFEAVDAVTPANTKAFYLTENTTGRDALTGQQYFGNTSYIQIVTKYTPTPAETYDLTGAASATLTDGDFWTGVIGGVRMIYNEDPSALAGISDVKAYDGGLNYHKFAIFDTNETDAVLRNRVLRNHHYSFDVTGITDLGEPTEVVDPTEPITEKTTIEIIVKVANWDKVALGEVEL